MKHEAYGVMQRFDKKEWSTYQNQALNHFDHAEKSIVSIYIPPTVGIKIVGPTLSSILMSVIESLYTAGKFYISMRMARMRITIQNSIIEAILEEALK